MRLLKRQQNNMKLFIIGFSVLPVILLLLFTYYPAGKLLVYSFTDYNGISPDFSFIKLRNWNQLLLSKEAWESLWHSMYYVIGGVVQNALALFFAVILNNTRLKGRNIFRGLIFLPFILNGTAVSYMFRYIYDFSKGPLNALLIKLGMAPISWLGTESIVNWSLALVCLWRYTGYLMIIYLAALQSIPSEYYEAAQLDGCNSFQRFFHITLPNIKSVIQLQMFLNISGAVNIFDIPFVITGGGPVGSSDTLAMKATQFAFQFNNYGLASAYGVFCTIMVIILYLAQNKFLYKGDD